MRMKIRWLVDLRCVYSTLVSLKLVSWAVIDDQALLLN
jgi:hypothetical protein